MTKQTLDYINTVEVYPHTIDTGLGTEASPYVNADNTAGIQTMINTLAAARGGSVELAASRYNITTPILITTPGIGIRGVLAGYNIDPNAQSQGISATSLITAGSCIAISGTGYPGRTGETMLIHLYLFGTTARQAVGSTTGTVGVKLQSYIDQPTLTNVNMGGFDYGIRAVNVAGGWVDFSYFNQVEIQGTRIGVYYDAIGNYGQHYIACAIAEQDEHNVYVSLTSLNQSFVFSATAFYRGSSAAGVTNPANVYFGGDRSRFDGCEFNQAGKNFILGTTQPADGLILAGNYNTVSGCQFLDNIANGATISGHDNVISGCVFNTNGTRDIVISGNYNAVSGCELNKMTITGSNNTVSGCTFYHNSLESIIVSGNNNIIYVSSLVVVTDTGIGNTIIGDKSIIKTGFQTPLLKGMELYPSLTAGNNASLIGLDINTSVLGGVGTVFINTGGSSYTNGTYTSVPLNATNGTGALATVVVSGGAITSITVTTVGSGYVLGAAITINNTDVGGTGSGYVGVMRTLSQTNVVFNGLRVDGLRIGVGGGLGEVLQNIAIGENVLVANTSGGNGEPLIAIGNNALTANTTGTGLISIGQDSLKANTSGIKNTVVGSLSGVLISTGNRNTIVGNASGRTISTSNYSTVIGESALNSANADYNTAIGSNAGAPIISGIGNVCIGAYSNTSLNSNYNIVIGFFTGGNIASGSANTIIGSQLTDFGALAISNNVVLGDGVGNFKMVIDSVGRVIFLAGTAATYPTIPASSTFTVPQVTNKGSLPWPKMTTAQRTAISSPLEGISVYDTDLHKQLTYDGTSWQISGNRSHTIFTPTTGGTVTLVNNQYNIINPAGALVALTVTLPASPANNDFVNIKFTQAVTTVTYSGGTVADGITSPIAGGYVIFTYDSGTTTWY